MRRSVTLVSVLSLLATLLVLPGPAAAQSPTFSDIAGNVHQERIERLAELGITRGCGDGRYCPSDEVTRQEMATFLARALGLPARSSTVFTDVTNPAHLGNVEALRRADIVSGATRPCRSTGQTPDEPYYCPQDPVNRNQMALFLQGAFELVEAQASGVADLDSNFHRPAIGALLNAGVTRGCGSGGRYCGTDNVTRAQMASFLVRALDLVDAGRAACPASPSPTVSIAQGAEFTASRGFPLTSALNDPDADRAYLFSNGLRPQRLVVIQQSTGEVLANHTVGVGAGTRVWASVVSGDHLYFGRHGSGREANLFRVALSDLEPGTPQPEYEPIGRQGLGSSEPLITGLLNADGGVEGREFWALTADDEGRIYTGAAGRRDVSPSGQPTRWEPIMYRFTPPEAGSAESGLVEEVGLPDLQFGTDARRERQLTALEWTSEGLVIGTGRGAGELHLVAPELLESTSDAASGSAQASWRSSQLWSSAGEVIGIYGSVLVEGPDGKSVVATTEENRPRFLRVDLDEPADDNRALSPNDVTSRRLPHEESILGKPGIDGQGRVVAAGQSSTRIYELDGNTVRERGQPSPGDFTRLAAATPEGSTTRGYTASGQVWSRLANDDGAGALEPLERSPLVQIAPEPPQSLVGARAGTQRYAVAGGNNKLTIHRLPDDGATPTQVPARVLLPGEAKSLLAVGGTVFAATYPGGELRRHSLGSDTQQLHASWDERLANRPTDIAYDEGSDRVVVAAKADFAGYGAIVSIPRVGSPAVIERGTVTTTMGGVLQGPQSNEPFTLDIAADGTALVGDRLGFITGLDHLTGEVRWQVRVGNRPITGIVSTPDGLVHALDDQRARATIVDGPRGVYTRLPSSGAQPLTQSAAGAGGELREVGGLLVAATRHRSIAIDRATGGQRLLEEGARPAESLYRSRPVLSSLPEPCGDILRFRPADGVPDDARFARATVRRPN